LAGFRRGCAPCSPADSQSGVGRILFVDLCGGNVAGMMLIIAIIAVPIYLFGKSLPTF
jgi:hypothetical protein